VEEECGQPEVDEQTHHELDQSPGQAPCAQLFHGPQVGELTSLPRGIARPSSHHAESLTGSGLFAKVQLCQCGLGATSAVG